MNISLEYSSRALGLKLIIAIDPTRHRMKGLTGGANAAKVRLYVFSTPLCYFGVSFLRCVLSFAIITL